MFRLVALVSFIFVAGACDTAISQETTKPNVLLTMADDM
jgi:hypothetical protein